MSAALPLVNTQLRAMNGDDLDDVVAIEQSAYEFPWSMGIFCDCLRVGYDCRVLVLEGRVAGYGIVSTLSHEAHVLNLCISPEYRRMGLARQLLQHLLELAAARGIQQVFLEVRPSNLAALRLYRQFGFVQIGVRNNYYRSAAGREDALVLCSQLDGLGRAVSVHGHSTSLH